ncbi:hypothetical protein QW180_02175 [Vibrio sinaloensis]|nr:hypothetical protein [Vibrio sinaloensis]
MAARPNTRCIVDDVGKKDFDKLETKLRSMEAYVTSDTFKVNREFNKL